MCIDKADTNVLGYLTVFERKERTSAYLSLADPISAKRILSDHPDFKVAYKSSDVDGCTITVYDSIKEQKQYICIRQGGGWMPGDFEGMARERALEFFRAAGDKKERDRIWKYINDEYGVVFRNDGFVQAEDYKNGWNELSPYNILESFWKPGDYYTMGKARAEEYNRDNIGGLYRERVYNNFTFKNALMRKGNIKYLDVRQSNQKNCSEFVKGWNECCLKRPMAHYEYRRSELGLFWWVEVEKYPPEPEL